jgi:hypothetical protein
MILSVRSEEIQNCPLHIFPPYYGNLKEAGREEGLRLAGEDRSQKKWVEAGMNCGSWRLIDGSGKNS